MARSIAKTSNCVLISKNAQLNMGGRIVEVERSCFFIASCVVKANKRIYEGYFSLWELEYSLDVFLNSVSLICYCR